jgi:hypothetical protein
MKLDVRNGFFKLLVSEHFLRHVHVLVHFFLNVLRNARAEQNRKSYKDKMQGWGLCVHKHED